MSRKLKRRRNWPRNRLQRQGVRKPRSQKARSGPDLRRESASFSKSRTNLLPPSTPSLIKNKRRKKTRLPRRKQLRRERPKSNARLNQRQLNKLKRLRPKMIAKMLHKLPLVLSSVKSRPVPKQLRLKKKTSLPTNK